MKTRTSFKFCPVVGFNDQFDNWEVKRDLVVTTYKMLTRRYFPRTLVSRTFVIRMFVAWTFVSMPFVYTLFDKDICE